MCIVDAVVCVCVCVCVCVQPPPRLTEEDITAVNQEVINTMGTMSDGNFICTLCIAELCGRKVGMRIPVCVCVCVYIIFMVQ